MTEGFLRLVTLEEAVRALLAEIEPQGIETLALSLEEALGAVLAEEVTAHEDLPGFARSSMDGYAVRASDTFGASESLPAYLELSGEVPMGRPGDVEVGPGRAARISTGGAIPPGADAVVMVENTELSGGTLEVVKPVAPGDNVLAPDEDVSRGSLLFGAGTVLGPPQIGALAALGIMRVTVYRRPVVGIISTGDELVPPEERPGPGQVRDVNSPALAAAVRMAGCEGRAYGIAPDRFEELLAASRRALEECDALLISGGSSVGVRDMTVEVIAELGDPGLLAHGLHLKPGKPTLVSVCGGKPVLGLPGNPASALAVFREVAAPMLSALRGEAQGRERRAPRLVEAVMGRSVSSAPGRVELVPVELEEGEGGLVAMPVMGKSSLIGTLARAEGQVRVPEGKEGLEKGEPVTVELS